MNKSELIACTGNIVDSKSQAAATIDAFLAIIAESLCTGDSVAIPHLGSFKITQRSARKGRNPQTGQQINIPARKTIQFIPDPLLKQQITDYTL